jgi:hypothetical protein
VVSIGKGDCGHYLGDRLTQLPSVCCPKDCSLAGVGDLPTATTVFASVKNAIKVSWFRRFGYPVIPAIRRPDDCRFGPKQSVFNP